MVRPSARRALGCPLLSLGLHSAGGVATLGSAQPSTALRPAPGQRQCHLAPIRPGAFRRPTGPHGHPPYLGAEPHASSSSALPGHRRRTDLAKYLGRTQTNSLALPGACRRQNVPGQVLLRTAPTAHYRTTPIPWSASAPPAADTVQFS